MCLGVARLICASGAVLFLAGTPLCAPTGPDAAGESRAELPLLPDFETGSAAVPALAAPAPDSVSAALTSGSEAVLSACWSQQALAGSAGDRIIYRGRHPWVPPPPALFVQAAKERLAPLPPELRGSIRYVVATSKSARLVALTFDLCETGWDIAGYDAGIVNYLRAHRIPATFFAGGKWMATHSDKAKQLMADPLFEVGNHTWTQLTRSPCAAAAGPAAVAAIPPVPRVFRFPYGVCGAASLGAVASAGLAAIQWSIVTGDPAPHQGARSIAAAVLRGVRPGRGSIIVAHANGRGWHTAEALPLFVPELLRRGYRFVTVSELLASGRPVSVGECYELRPGDNVRYNVRPRERMPPRQPAYPRQQVFH